MKTDDDVRTHHDEWIKRALGLWLAGLGDVVADARIAGRSRRGDALYTERHDDPALRDRLGELGELARGKVLFEVFRNAPSPLDLATCVVKLVELWANEARAARREGRKPSTIVVPTLCAVLPSMSREFADMMGIVAMSPDRRGLHTLLGAAWHTVVVVANELPKDVSTMWFRLLGRGKVQAQAVHELVVTSKQEPLRDATLKLLEEWRQSLPPAEELSEDVRELVMNLEQTFLEREQTFLEREQTFREREQTFREREQRLERSVERRERAAEARGEVKGRHEGQAEGKAEAVLAVLDARGLRITAAQRKQVLACTDGAVLDAWVRSAVTTPSVKALLSGGAPHRSRDKRS